MFSIHVYYLHHMSCALSISVLLIIYLKCLDKDYPFGRSEAENNHQCNVSSGEIHFYFIETFVLMHKNAVSINLLFLMPHTKSSLNSTSVNGAATLQQAASCLTYAQFR